MATNSAPKSTKSPAEERKAKISHKTECTGLRLMVTIRPAATVTMAKA